MVMNFPLCPRRRPRRRRANDDKILHPAAAAVGGGGRPSADNSSLLPRGFAPFSPPVYENLPLHWVSWVQNFGNFFNLQTWNIWVRVTPNY